MQRIVFYSWQSDLPNACNRGFIQTALEEAASTIAADNTVSIEPVIDRDTKGVPGAPDIASTIFAKITAAHLFVADVSITTRVEGQRPTPNPNVLIELGYALKALGHERVVLVFNQAFGKLEDLPFDLRTRRVLRYEMPKECQERAPERRRLEDQLDDALRAGLNAIPAEDPRPILAQEAVKAIEDAHPKRIILLRRALTKLFQQISALEPKKQSAGGTVAELIEAIDRTQELVVEFTRIVETIAVMNDESAGLEVLHCFGAILERYDLPAGFSGGFSNADFDYFKFLGHEMLTTLVAFLIKEQQWDTLARILAEPIPMNNLSHRRSGALEWDYASKHTPSLANESRRRERVSLHADILSARHSPNGGLGAMLSFEDFMAGDFFLFLRSQSLPESKPYVSRLWRPWSCLYFRNIPPFIQNSVRISTATQVIKALNLSKIEEFKDLLRTKGPTLTKLYFGNFWDYPISDNDIELIGTR